MEARAHVLESANHLQRAAEALTRSPVDYGGAARAALESVRRSYRAVIAWHRLPTDQDAGLVTLADSAKNSASMLRTSYKRALHLETLVKTMKQNEEATLDQRENAATGFFTARNTLSVVIGTLPYHVVADAIPVINRAESIRSGRDIPSSDREALTSTRQPIYPTTRRTAARTRV